jgi:hypothetical protein
LELDEGILTGHMPRDGARRKLAERVEERRENANFEIDEELEPIAGGKPA